MKTQVFVLVPYSVGPAVVLTTADTLIEQHQKNQTEPANPGRFNNLIGFDGCFADPITEGRFPGKMRGTLAKRICEIERLPDPLVPGAIVTPDGTWHDLEDHGWRMVDEPSLSNQDALTRWSDHYRELVVANPNCWVLEFWAQS